MGKQDLVDKTIRPLEVTPLQAQYTPMYALGRGEGAFSLGYFRGAPAFIDLDKLVVQPLARVEGIYALDKIDARDLVSITLPIGALPASGRSVVALTVPAGELWIVEEIGIACPVTAVAGETINVNVRLSLWQFPDARGGATIDPAGRAYYAADLVATSAAAIATTTVFSAGTELGVALRLPGGSVITLTAISSGNPLTAAKVISLTPYGRKAKVLVT